MDLEDIRHLCLRLPHVTEQVQWGDDLVFKVGGKMFVVAPLEASEHALSLKVSLEAFEQLQEIEGIVPAPILRAPGGSLCAASACSVMRSCAS
jgi:predicted DNA-binding protein (MmcQ/YjbR family)